jgi:hypothetical protein
MTTKLIKSLIQIDFILDLKFQKHQLKLGHGTKNIYNNQTLTYFC